MCVYSGFSQQQVRDWGWKEALHPDDLPDCAAKWEESIGARRALLSRYQSARAAAGFPAGSWSRATPFRDDQGRIIKWIGTCTDIEDRKAQPAVFEQQIEERTQQLADANNRLHEEMWERETARRELDLQNEKMMTDLTEARWHRATLLAKMGKLLQSALKRLT